MKAFWEHIEAASDGGLDATEGGLDAVDFYEPGVRDVINLSLLDITDAEQVDPVITYQRVREVMADAGYLLPPPSSLLNLFFNEERDTTFLATEGDEAFALVRPTASLEVGQPEIVPCYFYFAYCKDDLTDLYDVLAEVVTTEELEEILHGEE